MKPILVMQSECQVLKERGEERKRKRKVFIIVVCTNEKYFAVFLSCGSMGIAVLLQGGSEKPHGFKHVIRGGDQIILPHDVEGKLRTRKSG